MVGYAWELRSYERHGGGTRVGKEGWDGPYGLILVGLWSQLGSSSPIHCSVLSGGRKEEPGDFRWGVRGKRWAVSLPQDFEETGKMGKEDWHTLTLSSSILSWIVERSDECVGSWAWRMSSASMIQASRASKLSANVS